MTPERWQKIEQLCNAALEREASQRGAFLAQACQGDDELRREVESLLAQEKPAESFLESVGAEVSRRVLAKIRGADGEESMIGRRLGSYQVVSLLGAGGMGEVYQARDTKLGRDVAVKVLPAGLIHDADRLARFQREARMLAALNHPNIATIHGLEQSDSMHYLVMELVPGETLALESARGRCLFKRR
jgi:eukaryotic-like serine/threonine-protein kinase